MKRFLLPSILVMTLLLLDVGASAQRGRVYRGNRPMYHHSRTMVSIGWGSGFYGSGMWGYGWGRPRVGVNIGIMVPPSGYAARGIPPGALKQQINGITYFRKGDAFYRERQDGGYELVEAPIGAELNRLPLGTQLQKIEDKYYYEKNGILYYKDIDENGKSVYIIVGKNGELNAAEENDSYDDTSNTDDNYPTVENRNTEKLPTLDKNGSYTVRPQVGDRFEQLPRNSKSIVVNGNKLYVSPNNVYYKAVIENGQTNYEVVDVK